AVEDRPDLAAALPHLRVPQLEVAAVRLLPARVQREQQVEPAPPVAAVRVDGEVGMHVQEAAALRLVQPAALQRLVVEESLDPRHGAQELEEARRVQLVDDLAD